MLSYLYKTHRIFCNPQAVLERVTVMQFQILAFFVVMLLAALASAASPVSFVARVVGSQTLNLKHFELFQDIISKRDAPKRMSSSK